MQLSSITFLDYAVKNSGADQTEQMRRLICGFVPFTSQTSNAGTSFVVEIS